MKTWPAAESSIGKSRPGSGSTAAPWVAITSSRVSSSSAAHAHGDAVGVGQLRRAPGDQGQPLVEAAAAEHRQPDLGDRTQPALASLAVDEQPAQLALGPLALGDVAQHRRDARGRAGGSRMSDSDSATSISCPFLWRRTVSRVGMCMPPRHLCHLLLHIGSEASGTSRDTGWPQISSAL